MALMNKTLLGERFQEDASVEPRFGAGKAVSAPFFLVYFCEQCIIAGN